MLLNNAHRHLYLAFMREASSSSAFRYKWPSIIIYKAMTATIARTLNQTNSLHHFQVAIPTQHHMPKVRRPLRMRSRQGRVGFLSINKHAYRRCARLTSGRTSYAKSSWKVQSQTSAQTVRLKIERTKFFLGRLRRTMRRRAKGALLCKDVVEDSLLEGSVYSWLEWETLSENNVLLLARCDTAALKYLHWKRTRYSGQGKTWTMKFDI